MEAQLNPEDASLTAAADLFRALASPIRLAIVQQLATRPQRVGELVEGLGVSQPLVSQHLNVLKNHRLVYATQHGRERIYSLTDDHVSHVVGDAIAHTKEIDHDHHT